jgi:ribonuclease Z
LSNFSVTVLGSSAAIPTLHRSTSAQVLSYHNRLFLLDCGEGTQLQMRKYQVPFQRINEIFISHLHGDHFLGLPGLLSTMNLLGRTEGISIYAPPALEQVLSSIFSATKDHMVFPFKVIPLVMDREEVILEDDTLRVTAFPLNHRVPTFGFKFEEKFRRLKANVNALAQREINPVHLQTLLTGRDIQLLDGTILRYRDFTIPHPAARVFSYCTDTAPFSALSTYLKGTTTLYHEATFLHDKKDRAKKTHHSTAQDASSLAHDLGVEKLLIGHFSGRYKDPQAHVDEAKQWFHRELYAVEDGENYPIR